MKRTATRFQRNDGPNRNGSHEDHVMASKALPSPEVLRQLLRYEPETGKLFWKERSRELAGGISPDGWNNRLAGKEASWLTEQGYRRITFGKKSVGAHRVIWAMVHNCWPISPIDHIDGDRVNNRIENLRVVTVAENNRNCKLRIDNTSGVSGVTFDKVNNKWRVEIRLDKKRIFLGSFSDKDDAIAKRLIASKSMPFSERHGK